MLHLWQLHSPCGKKSTTWASVATKVGPTLNLDTKNMSSIVATWPPKWQQPHLTNLSSCAWPLALLGHDLRDQVLGDGHLHEIKQQDEDAKVQCAKGYRRNITLKVPTHASLSISYIKIASPHTALKFVQLLPNCHCSNCEGVCIVYLVQMIPRNLPT